MVPSDIRPPEKVMIELREGLAGAGQAEWREKSLLAGGNGPCEAWRLEEDETKAPVAGALRAEERGTKNMGNLCNSKTYFNIFLKLKRAGVGEILSKPPLTSVM